MSAADRTINYAGMVVGGVLGFTVGLLIYRRTMARAAELAAAEISEQQDELLASDGGDDDGDGDGDHVGREDSRLMRNGNANVNDRVDVDVAALMNDDDIYLWETDGAYSDGWDEEAGIEGLGKSTNESASLGNAGK